MRQPILPRSISSDHMFALPRNAITSSSVPFCDIHHQLDVSSADGFATTLHVNASAMPTTDLSDIATAGAILPQEASAVGK